MKIVVYKQERDYSGDVFLLRDKDENIEEAYLILFNNLEFNELSNAKMNYRYLIVDLKINKASGLIKDNEDIRDEFRGFEHISKNELQIREIESWTN